MLVVRLRQPFGVQRERRPAVGLRQLQARRRQRYVRVAPQIALEADQHGLIQHLLRIRPARIFLQGNIPAVLDRYIDAAAGLAALREAARLETPDQRAAGARVERVVVDLDEIGLSQGGSRGHLTPQYMGCVAGFERAAGNRAVSAVSSLVLLN